MRTFRACSVHEHLALRPRVRHLCNRGAIELQADEGNVSPADSRLEIARTNGSLDQIEEAPKRQVVTDAFHRTE